MKTCFQKQTNKHKTRKKSTDLSMMCLFPSMLLDTKYSCPNYVNNKLAKISFNL